MRCPHCGSSDVVRIKRDWNCKYPEKFGPPSYKSTWKCRNQHTFEAWDWEDND